MKGRALAIVTVTTIIVAGASWAEEMPMPSYSKKSYPYTYRLMENGALDLKSLCESAPPWEWKECRIKARWDFLHMCQHLPTVIARVEREETRKDFTRIKDWYCRSYNQVPIPAHDA
tara:strand:+ start:1630 stop:1980 length:351 start_codon:yes stop_codon:yes gene_type:complete